MRIALGLEYDGSSFNGWQSQPNGNTIQDTLENALSKIAGEPIQVICAGRTDAGVHALFQVVHFDTQAQRPENAWVRGVNAFLPNSITVLWARAVTEDFHARYSAFSRCYHYFLLNHPIRPALFHSQLGWFHLPLDLALMQEAAQYLIGEHDFSAFRSSECQAKTPIKYMESINIIRQNSHGGYATLNNENSETPCLFPSPALRAPSPGGRGLNGEVARRDFHSNHLYVFEFRANAFLHHMVRNIVGSLIYVGKGKYEPQWIKTLLINRDRGQAAPTFAPAGLYLSGISYDPKWKIPTFNRMIPSFVC